MKISVSENQSGKRVDKFLAEEFFLYSRGEIIKKIKEGKILVNNQKIKPSYVLEEHDEIEGEDLENKDDSLTPNGDLNIAVVFENDDLLIINKQAGAQVHPGFAREQDTVANWLIAKYPSIQSVHEYDKESHLRPGIVHRLDKETSGLLVVAKTMKAFESLKQQFKDRKVEKKYLAIAAGLFSEREGVIDKSIARSSKYRKQTIARANTKTKIRSAITEYSVCEQFEKFALVELRPKTGRMHQIRVHLESIGHPIIGDKVYGATFSPNYDAKRHLLHASEITFAIFDQQYHFVAQMPDDMADFIEKFGKLGF